MAQCLSDDEDGGERKSELGIELTCGVCMGIYREPVRLPCEHSFCKVCIDQVFADVKPGSDYRCPICRHSYQNKPKMTKHLVLVRLAEAYNKMMNNKQCPASLEEVQDSHTVAENSLGGRACRIHSGEEVTHLCFQEWELVCPLCISSHQHNGHTTTPLVQVTKDWKEEISDAKDRTKNRIDRLIQFLQNEKERLMIDMQHVGNDHLDSIHGLQAEATHRLEHCQSTMQSFREASRIQDHIEFVKGMMDFMQRMAMLAISPDDEIVHPSLNFDGIPLPSVLQTWKNEDVEGEEDEEEEEEEEEDDDDDDDDDNEDELLINDDDENEDCYQLQSLLNPGLL
ncbi:E3 ubiquitin-protein ligase TRIM39-like isoform X2 [Stegostoma tigrinum]|uniref:E3 ubiquitin-protein ligase TRIM39-like isoform X2 n=1 Tax=Stegostoma tigrinum TaxID=3053191 RepID=UPI0028708148|nr:E3 ubiquitin-protein ligase TRIM39-like isoform X2 [Stegostoma tigrinum]